ncbi:PREDICTED: RNA-editing ligase 2, mitochondrial-like [Amphimedon queenslandica]|uniref:RNA ligase domain-containing protein n=1 Tax=Amphimedon queenslandica TaxID=400682 RepID=A0AAN0IVL6_AMPQE|nr:PREDICTED: RNA-editing ligase 2, mitochondrial-like [Amphimedon queenslandica]|eukprot:XP_011410182.1 PREDICTED: RNA-editing ligase 2, mitochondrial-like [Amphimedon queenslandica]
MATASPDVETEVESSPTTFSLKSGPTFSKYEKMTEGTRLFAGPEIGRIKEWVAMEKIHGANLSLTVWSKGGEKKREGEGGKRQDVGVKIARRNDYLKDGEQFFGLDRQPELLMALHTSAVKLWDLMNDDETTPTPQSITIYGELFGGYYPHPSIPPLPNMISIQKEVAYSPDLKFCSFDIAVNNGNDKNYMNYDDAMSLFEGAGFMYSRPLITGTMEEVFNYELGFPSTIPAIFGLPPIDGNLAEGIVIKPLKDSTLITRKGPKRLIFKRKIEKFSERRALPRPENHLTSTREDEKWKGTKGDEIKYEITALITDQRVLNAITKIGQPVTKGEWEKIKTELVADVRDTLKEENEELIKDCDDVLMMNEIKKQCGIFIQQYKKRV